MAAHLGRANMFILQIISLLIPFLLFWKSKISARAVQLFLVLYGLEWIRTLIYYARIRTENGEDWFRLALILGVVEFCYYFGFSLKTYERKIWFEIDIYFPLSA